MAHRLGKGFSPRTEEARAAEWVVGGGHDEREYAG